MIPVSVIIPCYRCSASVSRALNSVNAQSVQPAEVILIDDASGDHTLATLEAFQDGDGSNQVRVVRLERNSGPAAARNAGWELATQAYLAFLDADDTWHPRKLEIQYDWMARHPDIAMSGHPCRRLRPGVQIEEPRAEVGVSAVGRWRVLRSNPFQTPSVMLRRDIPFRFPTDMCYAEDYLLWCRIVLAGYPARRFAASLAFLHKPAYGGSGLSSHICAMEAGELDVYRRLAEAGSISTGSRMVLVAWSLLRYFRRLIVSPLRGRFQQFEKEEELP